MRRHVHVAHAPLRFPMLHGPRLGESPMLPCQVGSHRVCCSGWQLEQLLRQRYRGRAGAMTQAQVLARLLGERLRPGQKQARS